ncbi:MAG: SUMF1/EgtB/PvdO family nonheme iron enzyme, partial [Alloprevotella sp.]
MRKYILFFMLLAFSMGAAAQGVVKRNVKQEQTKAKPKPKPATKPKPAAKPASKPSAEAAGYNVSFVCDVSNALLTIDGATYNSASGTYFLQTGKHSIKVSADGYEDYASSITVNSAHRSFNISMVKLRNIVKTFTVNGISFEMVFIEGGTFMMGCNDEYRSKPQHQVTLSNYYIAKTEVTQELWETVMGNNPTLSSDRGALKP